MARYFLLSGDKFLIEAENNDLGLLHEPFPNEHAARLQPPDKYDKYRRTKGGKLYGNRISVPTTVSIIWGHPKGTPPKRWVPQALRFPVGSWNVAQAKAWLKKNKIKYSRFEAAKKAIKASLQFTVKLRHLKEVNEVLRRLKKVPEEKK